MSLPATVVRKAFPLTPVRVTLFVVFRILTDWVRATHIREGNMLYSSYPIQMLIPSANTPKDTPRIMFDKLSGHCVAQSSLTHKIMHHRETRCKDPVGERDKRLEQILQGLEGHIKEFGLCPKDNGKPLEDFKKESRASLVAQWLRICLPVQGTRVRALVWEDPTCHGATGPVSHNY